ncbi:hypothetical protein D3C77_454430 [compost metagenome]
MFQRLFQVSRLFDLRVVSQLADQARRVVSRGILPNRKLCRHRSVRQGLIQPHAGVVQLFDQCGRLVTLHPGCLIDRTDGADHFLLSRRRFIAIGHSRTDCNIAGDLLVLRADLRWQHQRLANLYRLAERRKVLENLQVVPLRCYRLCRRSRLAH